MERLCKILQINISIHAARVGCDIDVAVPTHLYTDFNPRSPSGLRQVKRLLMPKV